MSMSMNSCLELEADHCAKARLGQAKESIESKPRRLFNAGTEKKSKGRRAWAEYNLYVLIVLNRRMLRPPRLQSSRPQKNLMAANYNRRLQDGPFATNNFEQAQNDEGEHVLLLVLTQGALT